MSGLEGTSTCWTGSLARVLVFVVVWAASIAGLRLIVQDRLQAEGEVQSEIVRRVETNFGCQNCWSLDRQLIQRLPESAMNGQEPPLCTHTCTSAGESPLESS